MKKLAFAALFALISPAARADDGATAYAFVQVPASAHAAALGGENITIIEDDPALVYHNPALLASVSDNTIGAHYMNYMGGQHTAGATYSRVLRKRCSVAGALLYTNYGSMIETDEAGAELGTFSANDIAIAGTISYMFNDHWAGGATVKWLASFIGGYNSMAVGVDFGLNYYDAEHEWSVSAVAKNLGGQIKAYDEVYESMPIDVQVGVSKRFKALPVRVSLTWTDLTHWHYAFFRHLAIGVDANLSRQIWVGMGYNFRRGNEMTVGQGEDAGSHGAGLSVGGGINMRQFSLSMAYTKYHVATSALLFNVAYRL